ncbi:MAG: hypothetical protein JEY79_10965 [Pseudodesulfovibrio sp.]|nr:hypothetical protein [Pseudodesulfovibrio sp.]
MIQRYIGVLVAVLGVWMLPIGFILRCFFSPLFAGWKMASVVCFEAEAKASDEEMEAYKKRLAKNWNYEK